MGFFGADYDVTMAEGYVRAAEQQLAAAKADLATAKSNGNYKRSAKNYNHCGKVGNGYDHNVWVAQDLLARRKKELAEAKVKAREAKAREAREAREAKAEAAREAREAKAKRAREAREARETSRSSSSSESYSSSSYSSSYDSYDRRGDSDGGNYDVSETSSSGSSNPIVKFFKDLYAPIFSSVGEQVKSTLEDSFERAFNPFKKRK